MCLYSHEKQNYIYMNKHGVKQCSVAVQARLGGCDVITQVGKILFMLMDKCWNFMQEGVSFTGKKQAHRHQNVSS